MKILRRINSVLLCKNVLTKATITNFLQQIPAQNYGANAALRRQAVFGDIFYPQAITWNQLSWKAEPTPKIKLIPWFLNSFLMFSITLNFLYVGLRQLLVFEKDPDLGSTQVLLLVLCICGLIVACTALATYALKVEEICFVLRNLQILQKQNGSVEDPSNCISLFLHLLIIAPLFATLGACFIPILNYNIDPTYFWFKEFSVISPPVKILLRIGIFVPIMGHGCMVTFALIITLVNCALAMDTHLRWMIRQNLFQQDSSPKKTAGSNTNVQTLTGKSKVFVKIGKFTSFPKYYRKYRQLQIVTIVLNKFCSVFFPIAMFVGVVNGCVVGYFVIKLSPQIPIPMTVLSTLCLFLIVLVGHAIIPMAVEITAKSKFFIMFWKEGSTGYRKRQLKSLKPLCLSIGPFFEITKQARGLFLSTILYYTATLVIFL